MNASTPPPTPAGSPPSNQAPEPDAIDAAVANREQLMRSMEQRRAEMFKTVQVQRQEALDSLQHARQMLEQFRPPRSTEPPTSATTTAPAGPRPTRNDSERARLAEALAALCALQGVGGASAAPLREQAAEGVAEAIAEMIRAEIERAVAR
jgi:hypothetical protein